MAGLSAASASAAEWSGPDRHQVLAGLDRAVDALAAVRAAVLVAERESGAWQGAGDRSFEAWRGRTARSGPRTAAAQVRQAEHLAAAPAAVAAVADGRISLDHAAAIAQLAATGSAGQRAALDGAGGHELLALAERVDAATFATTVARWAAATDPDALERDHEARRACRYLHVSQLAHGTFLKGRLDPVAGHRLALALEALTPRPAPEDDRDPGQRRADALEAMAGRILALDDTKPGGHVPPQVSFLITAETWAAARAERDRRRTARPGPVRGSRRGVAPSAGTRGPEPDAAAPAPFLATGTRTGMAQDGEDPVVAAPARGSTVLPPEDGARGGNGIAGQVARWEPATLEDGTPVPTSVVGAAMCDCAITRIVVDAPSTPVDLGRTQRLYTGAQRRAVIARDRGCAWPDCHAAARWCEIHHIRWWDRDDGNTSLDNGVALCAYHHHEVHRRDLVITRATPRTTGPPSPQRGPVSGGPPPALLTAARYTFRDRSGRLVAPRPVPQTHPESAGSGADAEGHPQPPPCIGGEPHPAL